MLFASVIDPPRARVKGSCTSCTSPEHLCLLSTEAMSTPASHLNLELITSLTTLVRTLFSLARFFETLRGGSPRLSGVFRAIGLRSFMGQC